MRRSIREQVYGTLAGAGHDYVCLFAATCSFLFVHGVVLVLYLQERETRSEVSNERALATLRMLCFIALLTDVAPYVGWEMQYGSAFSYFWPLHGARRLRDDTWRIGIFLKTLLITDFIALLFALCTGSFAHVFVERFNVTPVALVSRLSSVDAELVLLCFTFPVLITLAYTALPFRSKQLKTSLN